MENEESKLASLIWLAGNMKAAPHKTQRVGVWFELVVGIGNDNVAYITMDEESLKELCNRNSIDFEALTSNKRG